MKQKVETAGQKDLIINLTQHKSTEDQRIAGVVDVLDVTELLTFSSLPTYYEMEERALKIAKTVWKYHCTSCRADMVAPEDQKCTVMVGGAPWFMSTLEMALTQYDIQYVYAYSERVSEEVTQPDGSVRKVNVFKHKGFVRGSAD